jgi:phage-related protein
VSQIVVGKNGDAVAFSNAKAISEHIRSAVRPIIELPVGEALSGGLDEKRLSLRR